MEENVKIEGEEPKSWWKRLLLALLKSPVNTFFGLLVIYELFSIYVLGQNALTDKLTLAGLLFLWLLWYLFKNVIKLLLLAILIALAAYGWYYYSHQDQRLCEQSGGVWNEQTATCEEKISFWQKVKNLWQEKIKIKETSPSKSSARPQQPAVPTDVRPTGAKNPQ